MSLGMTGKWHVLLHVRRVAALDGDTTREGRMPKNRTGQ